MKKRIIKLVVSIAVVTIIPVAIGYAATDSDDALHDFYSSNNILFFDETDNGINGGGGGGGGGSNCATREECAQIILNSGWNLTCYVSTEGPGGTNAQVQLQNIGSTPIYLSLLQVLVKATTSLPSACITSIYAGRPSGPHSGGRAADIQMQGSPTSASLTYGNFLCKLLGQIGGTLLVGGDYIYPTEGTCNTGPDNNVNHYHVQVP